MVVFMLQNAILNKVPAIHRTVTNQSTKHLPTVNCAGAEGFKAFGDAPGNVKWNHIVVSHAVFWLFFRNMPNLLNFSHTP